jgi:hypothetical protein
MTEAGDLVRVVRFESARATKWYRSTGTAKSPDVLRLLDANGFDVATIAYAKEEHVRGQRNPADHAHYLMFKTFDVRDPFGTVVRHIIGPTGPSPRSITVTDADGGVVVQLIKKSHWTWSVIREDAHAGRVKRMRRIFDMQGETVARLKQPSWGAYTKLVSSAPLTEPFMSAALVVMLCKHLGIPSGNGG